MDEAIVGVIRRAGRVLVIQRGPLTRFAGYWSPPTGRIEIGETQEQAVVREMREELGLAVVPVTKVWESTTDDHRFRLHWWRVEENGNELTLAPAEASAALWVTSAEFLELAPTFFGGREFFRSVLPGIK